METKIIIGNEEYNVTLFDENITASEAFFAAFSGYMTFNGELPKVVLEEK
ncbi:MAG: hypothetical protein LBG67_01875 [Campylobacteraceae bacterium]|jgi:hypothetical protein|nr:hypothetical protein [Campylobacteraceae bacterium]